MYIVDYCYQYHVRQYVVILISIFICIGCSPQKQQNSTTKAATVSQNTTPVNENLQVQYANGFDISYHPDYKLIKVFNPFVDHSDTLRYVLIPRGTPPPKDYPNAQ